MAIIKEATGPFECAYWHIDGIVWYKNPGHMRIELGGYASAKDRETQYPQARQREYINMPAQAPISIEDAYVLILSLPAWSGATSDQ